MELRLHYTRLFSDPRFLPFVLEILSVIKRYKIRQVCSDVESTNRCLLKSIELPEAFWCRVSGTLGPGFLGAARCSLSRRAHVKAKGTLDSVEQKNYAVGEQKVGQPRRPTSCVVQRARLHHRAHRIARWG